MALIIITALIPAFILGWWIYKKDSVRPEPVSKLFLAFLYGVGSTFVTLVITQLLNIVGLFTYDLGSFSGAVSTALFAAALPEECAKLLMLWPFLRKNPYYDEYFDGIVYAAYLSLGFACVENISYVFQGSDQMLTALVRGVLAVPAHFLFAVTMGYYVSLAKFDPEHRSSHLWKAFFFPMLLHGTYDALLMVSGTLGEAYGEESMVVMTTCAVLFIVFIIFDIKLWKWGLKRIKRLQERSKEQDFDRLHPFDGFTWNF